jgi:hypothetical protein
MPDSSKQRELAQQLEKLQISHARRSQLANLEIWALVGTMDDLMPGFWSRFMVNRQIAFKESMEQKKEQKKKSSHSN